MNDEDMEEKIFNEIDKRDFFDMIKAEGIDIDHVCIKKKEYNSHFHKFNVLVDKLKEDEHKSLITLAGYLLQDYFTKEIDVLACFDENNSWALMEEAESKRDMKNTKSTLDNFLFL